MERGGRHLIEIQNEIDIDFWPIFYWRNKKRGGDRGATNPDDDDDCHENRTMWTLKGAQLTREVEENEKPDDDDGHESMIRLKPECAEFSSEVEEKETPSDKGERGMAGGEALSA